MQNYHSLITEIANKIAEWLSNQGYYRVIESEITSFQENFFSLNMDSNHPAAEPWQSLVFNHSSLLRTHNTGISFRELASSPNKNFAFFSYGKVFRNDAEDQTHTHQFNQLDLIATGDFAAGNLIATIRALLTHVFDKDMEIRFRPSYFPFTQPSFEVDIFFNDQWIEVLGCGILHPKVMQNAGFTDYKIRALAAGIGLERIAMIKYQINDIREFYKNDLRFLKQFN
ncbi:hypothetical protein [Mycoplasma sp. 'Moose RK']|uniref:tRNA ligase subunit PheS family protein n=1 Tax=Mycoplasma sp. 'Moose RK' TaxID=2780095 RepID=UPI0018C2FFF3|nr:hypothetical protein [Mycoplasma sp. 'Moose RK']MBG0730781.1 hypothetical protein [Mycoplasma sp. 'Moose RK']